MKKIYLLYFTIFVLIAFSASAFYAHVSDLPRRYETIDFDYKIPFIAVPSVVYVAPEAEKAGLKVGDRLASINGVSISSDEDQRKQIDEVGRTGILQMTVERGTESAEMVEISMALPRIERNADYYLRLVVSFAFLYVFTLFCILFGFWVVLIRPTDYLAWILLFLLLGLGTLGLESFSGSGVLSAYKSIFSSGWALSMLLFGIYFPERLSLDKRLPWLKWILIIPLGYQVFVTILSMLKPVFGVNLNDYLTPVNSLYGVAAGPVNMIAVSCFFAMLGWKSGTLESADARRRLRVMVAGTTVSMTPFFLLVLYKIFSRANGSFFDIAPSWLALLALLLMLLFPLTMAYVIVVHRAMNVSVVLRQGLQYALAKGGVRVLQFLFLLAIGLVVRWSINNYGSSFWIQIAIIVGGIALVPVIDKIAKPVQIWIDRRFFREAYNADQILSDLSENVRMMVETKPLLETVAATISRTLHVPQVAMLIKKGQDFVPAFAIGFDTAPPATLNENGRAVTTLRRNQHIAIYDEYREVTSTPTISLDEREQIEELNSQILLPMAVKNELSGIISLSPKQSEEPYTPSDMRLLKSVAAQTGLALDNSRLAEAFALEAAQRERLNAEVEIAREVQERLFPQELPLVDGLDYYGDCRPALGVGGDYYDFLELEEGKFGVAIGDISGKGIGASLMMASLQASLRGQTLHFKDDLAGLLSQINSLLHDASTSDRYATFFYSQYEPKTRKLSYVNAGHNPPFLLRPKDGDFEILTLTEGGPVVGMLPPMIVEYEKGEIILQPGDLIVGSTDGITEAMNLADEEWGEEAMVAELRKIHGRSAKDILDIIVRKADEFADGAKQHDDMTMIVVKVV